MSSLFLSLLFYITVTAAAAERYFWKPIFIFSLLSPCLVSSALLKENRHLCSAAKQNKKARERERERDREGERKDRATERVR